MHSRKMLVMKLDGWKDDVKQKKQEEGNEEGDEEGDEKGDEGGNVSQNIQELQMDDNPQKERELLDSIETLSTIFSPSELGRNLEMISAESRGDESKVEESGILTIDQGEESGNESDEPSGPGSEDEQVNVQETSVKQFSGISWSNDDACEKETIKSNLLFFPNEANISTVPRGRDVRTRRASSPNIKFTTSKTDQVSNKSKTCFSEAPTSSLTRIKELNQGNTITPGEKILTRRGSSPNLMFTETLKETTAEKPSPTVHKLKHSLQRKILTRHGSSPNLMFTAIPKDKTTDKRSLARQDLYQPLQQRERTRRGSSPSLMFTAMPKDTTAEEPSLAMQDSDQPPQQRARTRRASSPNLMFTAMPQDITAEEPSLKMHDLDLPPQQRVRTRRASSPNLMFTAMQQETDKPRLTSIHELALESIFTEAPSTPRQRSGRRSSIAVMTDVANSFVSELPSPKFQVTSLPELNETLQSFSGSRNRRDSVQESNIHDSLRKISRRLNAPLTGAQLEKRLQAHRVDASVGSSQTPRIACTPERKAPNELDMNDLEECRYIRRPIRK